MAVATPPEDFTRQFARVAPFSKMEASRRRQLLALAKPFEISEGETLWAENEVPDEVFLILNGEVSLSAEILAEPEPVELEQQGPGTAIGWVASLGGAAGVRAAAKTNVAGLSVPAPAFFEIARYDAALRDSIFSRAWKGEVWRAVLAEMERRTGRIVSAKTIVDKVLPTCIARDWPENEDEIIRTKDRVWVVTGGEGAIPGERWNGGDGVLWARLIGLPEPTFTTALLEKPKTHAHFSGAVSNVQRSSVHSGIAPNPSPKAKPRRSRSRGVLRSIAAVCLLLALVIGAIARWASRQYITQRISLPGRLIFSGDSRTLTAGVGGELSKFTLREGERIQAGTSLAVIRPPLDEEGARKFSLQISRAKQDLAFCESILAGSSMPTTGFPEHLVELASAHAQSESNLRVLNAINQGGPEGLALSNDERARVVTHFSNLRRLRDERMNNIVRDTSSSYDQLREAENAVREAQEELNAHVRAFSGAKTGDKDSAEQETRDYQRILATHNRNLANRKATLTRIRKDIAATQSNLPTQAESEPRPDMSAAIHKTTTELAEVKHQVEKNANELRREIAETEKNLEKIRADAAPRQVQALQPGYVAEAARLTTGTMLRADSALGKIVTRQAWQIECTFPSPESGRLEPGQELAITVADRYATLVYDHFELVPGSTNRVSIRDTRDEWRDGMAARVETTVIVGSLLDEWLDYAGLSAR